VRRLVAILVIILLLGFGASRASDWWTSNVNTPISSTSHRVPFHIDLGETPSQVGTDLLSLHLIRSTLAFDLYTRLTNTGPKLEAGTFVLDQNMSLSDIVSALQHGTTDQQAITFPEGLPVREQAKVVEDKKLGVAPNSFTASSYVQVAQDPTWRATYTFLPTQVGNPQAPLEGYLFPDTYLIDPSAGPRGLIKQQLDQFAAVFTPDLMTQIAQPTANRPAESVNAIVILASMVDREVNTDNDRGLVCSVYYNRLRIGQHLGVDATLLYALGRLTPGPAANEISFASPYNTGEQYGVAGLPPGPISNPGKAALLACINPPKSNYLYYFADRVGVTHFETNFQDFERDQLKYGLSGS
jgi:UPF0755 protein